MSSIRKSDEGFTLVEILVSIAVAAIVTVSLNTVVTTYLHVSARGRYLNLANSFVEAKVEALRNQGYNTINTGTTSLTSELPAQLPPGRSATMTVTNPSGGIKQVAISVTYKDQGNNTTIAYTTYLGELGVGQ
jgi:prepilin-type N-terminal cleavage/methylation domain-containing protein